RCLNPCGRCSRSRFSRSRLTKEPHASGPPSRNDYRPARDVMIPTFTYPWALLLLLALPAVVFIHLRKPRAAWQFSDHRILPAAIGRRGAIAWWGGLLLRLVGLGPLIVAIAGPRWVDETDRLPVDAISIAMVLDIS